MTMNSPQPFGRRGRPVPPRAPAYGSRGMPASADLGSDLGHGVAPELVAALMRSEAKESVAKNRQHGDERVPRSFRAALLAGFIVAILDAAANATFMTEAKNEIPFISFSTTSVPLVIGLLLAALWSGARSSALCLLVAHRALASLGRGSHLYYALAGGGVAFGFSLLMQMLGRPPGPGGPGMDLVSGMTAGLFYRLFAGTEPRDDDTKSV